ncbi:MAG TPA: hypothetical protein VJT49_05285, partial [Amycolatopsis sp.]|uniref:hypothetical protein n=1 Tax=Amycolatopsis sp. TaxID=37632 RepID=UPI002B46A268
GQLEGFEHRVRGPVGVVDPEHRQRGEHAAEAEPRLAVGVGALDLGQRGRELERRGVAIPNRGDVLELEGAVLGAR